MRDEPLTGTHSEGSIMFLLDTFRATLPPPLLDRAPAACRATASTTGLQPTASDRVSRGWCAREGPPLRRSRSPHPCEAKAAPPPVQILYPATPRVSFPDPQSSTTATR